MPGGRIYINCAITQGTPTGVEVQFKTDLVEVDSVVVEGVKLYTSEVVVSVAVMESAEEKTRIRNS